MRLNSPADRATFKNVWVIAETLLNQVQPVTYELLGTARQLADVRNCEVWTILLGDAVTAKSAELIAGGSDVVVVIDDPALANFHDEMEARTIVNLITKYRPEAILCGATTRGRALVPRVAVLGECGLTADCTGLAIDNTTGDLLQTRPAFGGNIMATIRSANHRPQLATVRPRVMKALPSDPLRQGRVITEKFITTGADACKRILEVIHSESSTINLADARFIISGGRGLAGREGFEVLRRLAERVGGALGASRAAVDAGWIPYTHQVGQTGQTVQSKVYLACGISGQIQHLVGMQSCDLIIAIDKNPDTPLMRLADIAIVGDLFEIIPELIDQINVR